MEKSWRKNSTCVDAVPARVLEQWMARMETQGVNLHGFCLMHGGEIIAERYFAPFDVHSPHRMYSVGKTLTGLGIGMLEEDGLLSLDEPVYAAFPEACPRELHPYVRMMTVRDLLEMRTAHASTTYKRMDGPWVNSFFHTVPDHVPGTVFAYDTSGTHVLSALIEKRTGMELMAYLKERALGRLGFSEGSHFLKNPEGVSQGGSGLICTLRDLAKVGWLLLCGGSWEGEQLLPRDYVRRASSVRIPTCFLPMPEERHGYGWQLWRTRGKGFALYGMAGQWCICLPEQQLVFTVMADTHANPIGAHAICQGFWELLFPCFDKTEGGTQPPSFRGGVLTVPGGRTVPRAADGAELDYRMDANAMRLDRFRLLQERDGGSVELLLNGETYRLCFGVGQVREGTLRGRPYLASGAWADADTFCMRVNQIGDELHETVLTAGFREHYVTVLLRQHCEHAFLYPQGFASGRKDMKGG